MKVQLPAKTKKINLGLSSFYFFVCFIVLLSSCSTTTNKLQIPQKNSSNPTKVLFLVDGLSLATLQLALKENKIPHIRRFFSLDKNMANIHLAKTVFSSSTYPGVISILTTSNVSKHGVISNRFLYQNKEINLEDVFNRREVNRFLQTDSVFKRLQKIGKTSASLSEPFQYGCTAAYQARVEEGLHYINKNYSAIDRNFIESLEQILEKNPKFWPDFIFVHLIGVDALSHEYGHLSREAILYLEKLDAMLGKVFSRLKKAEVALTSDHGFLHTPLYFPLQDTIEKPVRAIIESRIAHIYFPSDWSMEKRNRWTKQQIKDKSIHVAGLRHPISGAVSIYQNATQHSIASENIATALLEYFQAPTHPDAVLVAAKNIKFIRDGKSQHGGLLKEEFYVPLLLRNLTVAPDTLDGVFDNTKLLQFLFHDKSLPTKKSVYENSNTNPHHIR